MTPADHGSPRAPRDLLAGPLAWSFLVDSIVPGGDPSLLTRVTLALIAIYLLATGVKGLQLAGAPVYVDDLFNGAALIIAVALAARSARKV